MTQFAFDDPERALDDGAHGDVQALDPVEQAIERVAAIQRWALARSIVTCLFTSASASTSDSLPCSRLLVSNTSSNIDAECSRLRVRMAVGLSPLVGLLSVRHVHVQ